MHSRTLSLWGRCVAGLLALCAWAVPALAASAGPGDLPLRFEAVGQNGVIPNNVMAALAQDQQGFLWVGSAAGLLRFDGYSFRQLQLSEGADGSRRSLGFVRALLVGRDGRLWIGSDSGGLAVHDPASERTQLYRHDPSRPEASVPPGTLLALAEAPDGQLWLGTALNGLSRFDPARQRSVHYRHQPGRAGSLPDNSVQALLLDRDGTLWVGGLGGLSRKPAGSEQFEPVALPTRPRGAAARPAQPIVLRLHQAEDGQIWVGTQQGDLARVDPASLRVQSLDQGGVRGAVYALSQGGAGQIWVGRAGGLELRAVADGRLQQALRHNPRNASSLGGNEVRCVLRDRGGWMWVGGFGGGLQRHDADQLSIGVRKLDEDGDAVFEDPSARALLELDNGEVWVGTTAQGLGVLDASLRLRRQIDLRSALKRSADEPVRVSTLARARDGTVWVGVDAQLLRVDARGHALQSLNVAHGRLRRTVLSRSGDLWIGSQDGLYRLPGGQGPAVRHHLAGGVALEGEVSAIVEAEDGALWVGGEAGLFLRPAGSREFQTVPTVANQGLRNGIVTGLLIDRRQRLWVDTATGLHQMTAWDGRRASFDAISERKGIGGRAFGANLLDDERGRIWSQNYVYDPSRDHLYELTPADGADAGTSWFRSYARLQDGRFLFGAGRGLMVVDPERFEGWAYQPPVVASELRIDGERVSAGALAQGLLLNPQQRSFSLEFAALDYSDPGRVRYAYQLEGFDRSWLNTSATQRQASYSNLSPGHYLLRVRASNRSGLWSPHELAIPIQVQPAWWQTWWLRLALALGGAGLLYALVRWRTGFLERRQLGLEQRVRERTAELEALSTALRDKSLALEEKSLALEDLSLSDPLTGLRNRRFLAQHIEADVAMTLRRHEAQSRQGGPLPEDADLIFFLIDIDHFKDINDRFGHAAGDRMLKQMRDRLRQVFRDTDYLVRWGGEEFLIVARGSPRSHAPELAERMRALVAEQPFVLDADGLVLHKTCSIGFACFPVSQQHPRALDWNRTVDVADAMLYAVKRGGRDGWMGVLQASSGTAQQLRERAAADWLLAEGVQRLSSALRAG